MQSPPQSTAFVRGYRMIGTGAGAAETGGQGAPLAKIQRIFPT
jgi:hypothetical protein